MEGGGQNETGIDQLVVGVIGRPCGLDMIIVKLRCPTMAIALSPWERGD
jgi:hypothetical protein